MIRVAPPWLVIEAAGNRDIRLDLRMLDRVSLRAAADTLYDHVAARAGGSGDASRQLVLSCGGRQAIVEVNDEALAEIVAQAQVLTRAHMLENSTYVLRGPVGQTRVSTNNNGWLLALSSPIAGAQFELSSPSMVVGREPGADIRIQERLVSRSHILVSRRASGGYAMRDLQSANGCTVYRGDLAIRVGDMDLELRTGDRICLGHVMLQFAGPNEELTISAVPFDTPAEFERFLQVGDDTVVLRGGCVHVGPRVFGLHEVEHCAWRGENLYLEDGSELEAALAVLVVGAVERERSRKYTDIASR